MVLPPRNSGRNRSGLRRMSGRRLPMRRRSPGFRLALLTFVVSCAAALAPSPACALERQEAYVNTYPPSFGDHCWTRYDLLPALSDTLCLDLIWDWSGFRQGDVVGLFYEPDGTCAADCWQIHDLRFYFPQAIDGPGDEVEVSLWCADEQGCPTGEPIDRRTIDPEQFALKCGGVIPAERTSWGRIKARYGD